MLHPTPTPTSAQSRDAVRALIGEYIEQKTRETGEQSVIEQSRRVRSVLLVLGLIACAMVWILPSLYGPPDERVSPE